MGAASTELVVAMPALLLLVLVSVHVGLWFHARHIVAAASEEGARSARVLDATESAGEVKANQLIDDLGPNVVRHRSVAVTYGVADVTVTVAGESPSVIPGLTTTVSATTTSPLEVFRP